METVRSPKIEMIYAGKDITQDVTPYLVQFNYTDHVQGKTDEISFTFEDTDKLWRNSWRPSKKDVVEVSIGYNDLMVSCGTFEVDQIDFAGPPDQLTMRGMAAGISKAVRTRLSSVHEKKTLKQIAQTIADKHGLTLQGDVNHILIQTTTQNRETDFAFLNRLAISFGYVFSVRDKILTFMNVFDLDATDPVKEIDRVDLIRYSIKDKTADTYKSAAVRYQEPVENKSITAQIEADIQETANDVLELREKCENEGQAKTKAEAALHFKNTKAMEGTLTVEGDPLLVAGNSFDLTGMGYISGKYKIQSSSHTLSQGGGYVTTLNIKRVGTIDSTRWVPRNIRETTSNIIQ
jgi:phage protein D